MARDHARIKTAIWGNAEFRALTGEAQRLYLLALSQPGMSYCGVVPYQQRRWATLAADSTPAKIRRAASHLEDARFIVVDEDTEEWLIRTFIRHDGLMAQPNVAKAAAKAFHSILSQRVRNGFLVELHKLYADTYTEPKQEKGWEHFEKILREPFTEPFTEPFENPSVNPSASRARVSSPSPHQHQDQSPAEADPTIPSPRGELGLVI